jgi:predicted enzyme related to lactoylglutathione lyase
MFLGLRTVIYPMSDLDAGKAWYTKLLGGEPYFDEPFYVGFDVGGYELGLVPKGDDGSDSEPVTYWGVRDADSALAALIDAGATLQHDVIDVGESIRVATVREPNGNLFGVIENPHFVASVNAASVEGPGR